MFRVCIYLGVFLRTYPIGSKIHNDLYSYVDDRYNHGTCNYDYGACNYYVVASYIYGGCREIVFYLHDVFDNLDDWDYRDVLCSHDDHGYRHCNL